MYLCFMASEFGKILVIFVPYKMIPNVSWMHEVMPYKLAYMILYTTVLMVLVLSKTSYGFSGDSLCIFPVN